MVVQVVVEVNCCSGGTGNTPPTSPPQGNPGGDGINAGHH
jgi:hypothetical protein